MNRLEEVLAKIDKEPEEYVSTYKGFDYMILRIPALGILNGYVGLPKGHPDYGKSYDDIEVSVHGGLTYNSYKNPKTKEEDDLWWIGFDTGHYGDLCPGLHKTYMQLGMALGELLSNPMEEYRNFEYVKNEVEQLIDQLNE
jgi:hypothetical protein